ncbi:MAG: cysteine synthase A [Deltaproteobacteria bacterium]|nr:cysteine synthase A [Deltaproteobacteria bacterium]
MKKLCQNILEAIGNTPIVKLNSIAQHLNSSLYVKCEFMNPGGSVKDRIGIHMIEDAEKKGLLKPGGTIVEGTSGNTGVGLAIAANVKGYKTIFVMPDKMSEEKIRNLRAFGAKVIITPTAVEPDDPRSYYSVSRKIAEETPHSFFANQYANLSNRETHYQTTGPEIWEQTQGKIDIFVAGMGTGGTISGAGKYLKEQNPNIKIIGVDPIGSIFYEYFKTKKVGEAKTYLVEGVGEDILPENMDFSILDDIVQVTDKESFLMTRRLVKEEGIFAGGSSGFAVQGAIQVAEKLNVPKNIVVLLPDSADRYLSKIFNDTWMKENGCLDGGEAFGTARDIINEKKDKEVKTAKKDDSPFTIIDLMKEFNISQLPVFAGANLVGVIEETPLLRYLAHNKNASTKDSIEHLITKNIVQCSLDEPIEKISHEIHNGKVVVVYEGGKCKGIITKIDLITHYKNKLHP